MPKKQKNPGRGRGATTGERQYTVTLNRRFQGSMPHSSFPDRAEMTLDYWTVNRVNPGVVTYQDTVFNLNSLFDPEFTGVGHQPREFDTWASVYSKYRVLETMVEADVRQRAAHGISVCLVPSNSSTALVVTDYPQELPRAIRLGITSSNQPTCKWAGKVDMRAILGMTQEEFRGDDTTGALVTASPSQLVHLHVFAAQLDGTTACDFEFTLRLRFRVEFYDRKTLAPSALVAAVAARISQLQQVVAAERDASASHAAAAAPHPPEQPSTRGTLAEALASAFLGTSPRK